MLKKFIFSFVSSCSILQATPFLDDILVLGIGGNHGAFYKKEVFRVLRSCSERLHVCDTLDNPIASVLLEEKLIDSFFPVAPSDNSGASDTILKYLEERGVRPSAIFTVREEWLQISAQLSKILELPHQKIEAYQNSQDKYRARKILEEQGIENFHHRLSSLSEIRKEARIFGYPCFVKPQGGIRSELARLIDNEQELDQYIQDACHLGLGPDKMFVLEEVLEGHEVDADIVLYEGTIVYGNISDNFPTFLPFTLETGQLSPSILPKKVQNKLLDHAYHVVRGLGYDRGVLHVELMLRKNGDISLIEVNGRPGGMYIADWHKHLWGVDLIKAQLAIAAGQSPEAFLRQQEPLEALAQVCITSNCLQNLDTKNVRIDGWSNIEELSHHPNTYKAELWDPLALETNISINGHPNVGALTVRGRTAIEAFQRLLDLCHVYPPTLATCTGTIEASMVALNRFCVVTPGIERFQIRHANNDDLKKIQNLLTHLSKRVFGDFPSTISPDTTVLIAYDSFSSKKEEPAALIDLRESFFRIVGSWRSFGVF